MKVQWYIDEYGGGGGLLIGSITAPNFYTEVHIFNDVDGYFDAYVSNDNRDYVDEKNFASITDAILWGEQQLLAAYHAKEMKNS